MIRGRLIQITKMTPWDIDHELWIFQDGEEVHVGPETDLSDPYQPVISVQIAMALIRQGAAQALNVKDLGADLELVGVRDPDFGESDFGEEAA